MMLVASRRTPPSEGAAPAEPTVAGKTRKAVAAVDNATDRPTNQEQEQDYASAEEKAAVPAHGSESAAGGGDAPAEPIKRKRGRRKLIHDEEERKLRRKMQCKLNQRRYRARQRGMITTLSLDAEKTIDSIQELEAYHRFLCEFDTERTAIARATSGIADRRPTIVVEQFIALFRHGFALHSVDVSDIQESFLRFAMDRALQSQGATERGIDALILQLKRYSSYHALFEIVTETIHVVDELRPGPSFQRANAATPMAAVVHVSGKLHLRVSRDTVMLLYPHIIEDEELNLRVVGHEIYPTFSMVFYFNEFAKVAKFELAVDFVAAFAQLLGSFRMTERLMHQAIITPYCELGVDPHGASNAKPKGSTQLSLKFILL